MKRFLVIFVAVCVVVGLFLIRPKQANPEKPIVPTPTQKPTPTPTSTPSPTLVRKTQVLIENVPFAPQAPDAQWKDERFQDGCEEAAALLAVYWAKNLTLDKTKAKEEILAMSAFQSEKYQEFRDTSAFDTANRLIAGYFNYDKFAVKNNISLEDIKTEVAEGNLVIVPTNGQTLNNPHFTPPGPERHNIVIRGFDETTNEFITNDPGIKEGEMYRYPQKVLFTSIRDYPTGYHQPIINVKKVMIVIKKA